MGAIFKLLILSLCLFPLLTFSGCATLPRIEDYGPLGEEGTPKIIGPKRTVISQDQQSHYGTAENGS